MINKLPQLQYTLVLNHANPLDAIEYVNLYIENNDCKEISVDISSINIIDASYISTICSTNHFIKYPDGKISWKIKSSEIINFNNDFNLGNCEYIL